MTIKVRTPLQGTNPVNIDTKDPITKTAEELETERLAEEARLAAIDPVVDPIVDPVVDLTKVVDAPTELIITSDGKDVKYIVDTEGNATLDGKVVYTKDELVTLAAGEDDDMTIDLLEKTSGIEVLDETGKKVAYELTLEGLAKRESDIKALGLKEGQTVAIKKFFESNPDLYDVYLYKQTYGTFDGFTNHVDYSKVTLAADNVDQLYDIIYKAELEKGNTPAKAKRYADLSKNDESLLADATEALTFLSTAQNKVISAKQAEAKAAIEAEAEAENMYYGVAYTEDGKEKVLDVKDSIYDIVVKTGKIGDLAIPLEGLKVKGADGKVIVATRKQIFDYISVPVVEKNGIVYTQAQIDDLNRTNNKNELVLRYINNLLGNDISQLTKSAIRKDNVLKIKAGTGEQRKIVIKSNVQTGKVHVNTPLK